MRGSRFVQQCVGICADQYGRLRDRTSLRTRVLLAVGLVLAVSAAVGSQIDAVQAWYATTYSPPSFGGW